MAAPKIIPYDVELRSVNPIRSFDRPKAYTNDLNSVRFQFKVLDMTSEELATATAVTLIYMRDGSFFANPSTDVSRVGNVFSYLLKENEGNHAGVTQIQLIVTVDGAQFASQLFDFEIINGLETKVAQEVMIYDWTMLTREARDYIDQFVADELLRDAQFDNNEFDRNTAFVVSQDARTLAFGTEQTNRGTAFTAEQNERTTAFNESESGRTTAETGRVTAEDGRVIAENNRVTKEGQRVTAENNRLTAEGNRVTAETGRVTAENARVTAETNRAAAFTAFDTRLTAEETATTNNKISAVKGKTFADVDARFEDIEFDTAMMANGMITNGDFSNNTTGWNWSSVTPSVSNNKIRIIAMPTAGEHFLVQKPTNVIAGNKYYVRCAVENILNSQLRFIVFNKKADGTYENSPDNAFTSPGARSLIFTPTTIHPTPDVQIRFQIKDVNGSTSYTAVGNEELTISYVQCIDLTAIFGVGNEPTSEQMDSIMAKFTNSWFNASANLFRSNAALIKLMALDARTEFDMFNIVENNILYDAARWSTLYGTNVASGGVMTSTANGNANYSRCVAEIGRGLEGKWVYVRMMARTRSSDVNSLVLTLQPFGSTVYNYQTIGSPVIDQWYTLSGLKFIAAGDTGSGQIKLTHDYLDAATASGKSIEIKNVVAVNLTNVFGSGREPSQTDFEKFLARYPNNWFTGYKPIHTIETLHQEKANKAQEAWITPTLYNGATGTPKYYKDEMGVVRFKGRVLTVTAGSAILNLPAGYRLLVTTPFPVYSNNGSIVFVTVGDDNTLKSLSSLTGAYYLDLSPISYRAEA